jgi:hypothetical protein
MFKTIKLRLKLIYFNLQYIIESSISHNLKYIDLIIFRQTLYVLLSLLDSIKAKCILF